MSGRHLGIFFRQCVFVFFQAKCLRRMLRCLGDTWAFFSGNVSCFFSGNMSERHVKMSWRHLGIFQGKCLRDMFRCLGDIFFTGKMPERHFKICRRHLVFFRQDV